MNTRPSYSPRTPVDRFTVEPIGVEYVFPIYIRLVRHNCSRLVPVGCRQLSTSDLRDERLDREPMAVMVPAITASSSTSRCSPWWRSDESAKTAVSRPKKRGPIGVSYARARLRPPAERSFRRDRCSRWSGRRSARTPASACPIPSPVVPDYRRSP